jgi:hypothetical protein
VLVIYIVGTGKYQRHTSREGRRNPMKKNFMDNELVFMAYDRWVNSPTPFENNYFNRERFYSFVIACVKYVKYQNPFVTKQEAWKSIDMNILKKHLNIDLKKREIQKEITGWQNWVYDTLVRFETLFEYEKIRYLHGLR